METTAIFFLDLKTGKSAFIIQNSKNEAIKKQDSFHSNMNKVFNCIDSVTQVRIYDLKNHNKQIAGFKRMFKMK